jgi:hypothetical protein
LVLGLATVMPHMLPSVLTLLMWNLQEMKHRTYYLSNGTIRVAGKLVTRCAEPYAEGDVIGAKLNMDTKTIEFWKNNVLQGSGDGLPGGLLCD